MAYMFFLLFIWANTILSFSAASLLSQTNAQTDSASGVNALVPSPSHAPAIMIRKLGRQSATPCLSPSEPPDNQDRSVHFTGEASSTSSSSAIDQQHVQERQLILAKHHHHRMFDKSVAGGVVILGGLATVFMVAVLCYIRATGRYKGLETAATAATP